MEDKDYSKTMEFEGVITNKFDDDIDLCDMRDFAEDIELIRQYLVDSNIYTSHYICFIFWSGYSYGMSAGWLAISRQEVLQVAKDFMKGTY
jgi:hypothetical protein